VFKDTLNKTNRFLKFNGLTLKFLCVEVKSRSPPYFPALEQYIIDRELRSYQPSPTNNSNNNNNSSNNNNNRINQGFTLHSPNPTDLLHNSSSYRPFSSSHNNNHNNNQLQPVMMDRIQIMKRVSHGHGFIASASAKRYALTFYLESNYIDLCVAAGSPGTSSSNNNSNSNSNSNVGSQLLDEPKVILKKGPLPLNWRTYQASNHTSNNNNHHNKKHTSGSNSNNDIYEAHHLICGQVIDVYGRLFLLVDCDSKTKEYATQSLQITQQPVVLVSEEEEKIVQPIPVLGDGFLPIGSNEDTLAT
jgi:hypothetical protein